MATVTQSLGSFNNGQADLSVQFNDANGALLAVVLRNDGPAGTIAATISDPATGAVVWQGTRLAATGTTTQNARGWNVTMTQTVKSGVTYWGLPYTVELQWYS